MRSSIRFFGSFLLLLDISVQVSAQCGALVTYRQHADLLRSAPRCLLDGCSQGLNDSTISSPCPSKSPCSAYWNMFVEHFDQKNPWCSDCGSDVACRISGWPVLNATTLCQTSPNHILFGEEGCCVQGDEPFQLAKWTGSLCNGTEWREQFEICGGMACLDWREWIMPWNWTVQNTFLSPDQQVCKAPSKYLAIYAGEHFFWLVATFGIGFLRLWIAKHEEANNRSIFRYLLISTWAHLRSKQNTNESIKEKLVAEGEHLRPSITDPLKWGFPVIMGVVLAGLQLGFNFWVAHIIKSAPGYNEVPLHMLALLFCCRPRLSWLSCLLALLPDSLLERAFKFKHKGDGLWAAKLVLSSVAVSSAVTEAIMQLLGAYFLGTTANVGRLRGFYTVHQLRPKMWGQDARRMYLGALFWSMLCIPLLGAWFLIALFFSTVYHAVAGWRRKIFRFLEKKEENVPEIVQGPVKRLRDYINPDPVITGSTDTQPQGAYDQPYEYYGDQPQPVIQEDPFADQPTRYEGPGSGNFSNDLPMPVRYDSRRSQYSAVAQSEFNDQPMRARGSAYEDNRVASGGYIPTPSAVQRRTPSGSQYNSLAQTDDTSPRAATAGYIQNSSATQRRTASGSQYYSLAHTDDISPRAASGSYAQSPSATQRRTASGSQYNSLAQTDNMDTIDIVEDQPLAVSSRSPLRHEVTVPSHRDAANASLLVSSAGAAPRPDPPSSSGNSSRKKRSDYTDKVNWKWQGWESKIIWAGAVLGMLAYAAQWIFWDGFVKASGDRFCPPNFWKVNGVWWGGAFVCESSLPS